MIVTRSANLKFLHRLVQHGSAEERGVPYLTMEKWPSVSTYCRGTWSSFTVVPPLGLGVLLRAILVTKTLRDEDTETGRRHEMWDDRELRLAILYVPSPTADGVRSWLGTPDTAD